MSNSSPTPLAHVPIAAEEKTISRYESIDTHNVFLGGLFVFALLTVCYVASSVILPIIAAIVLKLVLQPAMRLLQRLHIPAAISALIVIGLLFTGIFGMVSALSAPAMEWAQEIPAGIEKVQHELHGFMAPIKATQTVVQNAAGLADTSNTKAMPVTIQGSSLSDRLITNTQSLVSGAGETFLVLYFLLASGDIFMRRFIEVLPRFHDKRQAVLIMQQIESDISAYLATITLMNVLVGLATSIALAAYGLHDAVLWGVIVCTLNYIPMLGPLTGAIFLVLAGIISQNSTYAALVPAAMYLAIQATESTFLTPMLLSRRFTLNPVLIILAIIFWYWMWGVPGAILATPILAVSKIICDRIEALAPLGHFMEG